MKEQKSVLVNRKESKNSAERCEAFIQCCLCFIFLQRKWDQLLRLVKCDIMRGLQAKDRKQTATH